MTDPILSHDLPLLAGLSQEDLSRLEIRGRILQLTAWETLFQESDQVCDVYFLISGALMAIHWTEDGREIIFTRFRLGDHFGEIAAIDGGPRSLAVVAREDSKLLLLERSSFLRLIDCVPDIRNRLLTSLTDRIRQLTHRNLQLVTQSVEQRVRSYLVSLAFERRKLHPGAVLEDMPTHAEIAASIGANREIVSRVLSQLRRSGVIETGRCRIQLLDPAALTEAEPPAATRPS